MQLQSGNSCKLFGVTLQVGHVRKGVTQIGKDAFFFKYFCGDEWALTGDPRLLYPERKERESRKFRCTADTQASAQL